MKEGEILKALKFLSFLFIFSAVLFSSAATAAGPGVRWLDFDSGLALAKKENKTVVVDFMTSWCRDCKKMDSTTFMDKGVADRLGSKFVPVRVNAEQKKDLAARYGIFAYPTFVALDPSGKKLTERIGYTDAKEFMKFLDGIPAGR